MSSDPHKYEFVDVSGVIRISLIIDCTCGHITYFPCANTACATFAYSINTSLQQQNTEDAFLDVPCTTTLAKVPALPMKLLAQQAYCPESSAVRLSRMRLQVPDRSAVMMWRGSSSKGRPSKKWRSDVYCKTNIVTKSHNVCMQIMFFTLENKGG